MPQAVNIFDDDEARYWCSEFQCTEDQLQNAVNAVGGDAAAVREQVDRLKQRKTRVTPS